MKKILALTLALLLCFSALACAKTTETSTPANAAETVSDAPAAADKTYTIGICQLVQHPALDMATQGFMDAISAELGDKVTFLNQNASGDPASCAVICGQFVSEEVDLILANATPALSAAASATNTIPVLGTSVTNYGEALTMTLAADNSTGINVSGTSDYVSAELQAALVPEMFPEAKTVGLLYCSGEANSVFQAEELTAAFTALGLEVQSFTFADSNDVAAVTKSACDAVDVIFIPTDNTAASCAEAINNVAINAKTPIVAGEESLCKGCGTVTLTLSYYELGKATGKMALDILAGADVSTMPVQEAAGIQKMYNASICNTLGLTVPEGYVAIAD